MLLCGAALLGACVLPLAAQADDHCAGDRGAILVFSQIGFPGSPGGFTGNPTYDSKRTIGCNLGEEPNTAYIYPGSNQLLVRFNQDLKVKTLRAKIEGLGYNKEIVLKAGHGSPTRQAQESVTGAATIYDSDPLPVDPAKTGTFKVTVFLADGPVSDTYRTVGS